MSPRTFNVSRARAFVGNVLGNEISNYTSEELEAMVRHMEDFYAEQAQDSRDEDASDTACPEE